MVAKIEIENLKNKIYFLIFEQHKFSFDMLRWKTKLISKSKENSMIKLTSFNFVVAGIILKAMISLINYIVMLKSHQHGTI